MTIEKIVVFAETGDKDTKDLDLVRGFPSRLQPARQWHNWLFNKITSKINELIDGKLDQDSNATSASKLQTARTITASGAATGSTRFDGSKDEQLTLTLANSGVVAGSYGSSIKIPSITVNQKGLITSVSEKDITIIDNLTTGGSKNILSAEQGKVLNTEKLGKTENSVSTTKLQTARKINGVDFDGTGDIVCGFGVGQRWRDETLNRKFNTVYINSDNNSIMVDVDFTIVGGSTPIFLIDDENHFGQANRTTMVKIIPPGSKYEYRDTSNNAKLVSWSEYKR